MRACTIIFNAFTSKALLILALTSAPAFAQEMPEGGPPPAAAATPKRDDPGLFDETSPYLDYGDFNMNEEENEDSLYFQYGRFFGMSLGLGYQTATGNRGKLYEPAFPRFDVRLQYWFNFDFAVDLGLFFANHAFTVGGLQTQVKMLGYESHLKYYFDVRNASAPITFANPYIEVGVGAMSKSQTTVSSTVADSDSTFTTSFGGGFEFPIAYKKTYLNLELLYHTQSFQDTSESDLYSSVVPDLSGGFLTLQAHLMFVW